MFGVVLMHYRDAALNLIEVRTAPHTVHHDLDAPAWWHFSKKRRLYYDGFVPKGHRALMQFFLVPANGPDKFHDWEAGLQGDLRLHQLTEVTTLPVRNRCDTGRRRRAGLQPELCVMSWPLRRGRGGLPQQDRLD